MNESLDDLIQRALDGDLSPAEQARLESRLAADAPARRRYDELAGVFRALGAAKLEDAPAGLRDDVMRAVRGTVPGRAASPVPVRAGRPAFSWLRVLLPAAAAAVAILVLWSGWSGQPGRAPRELVSGTMSGVDADAELRLGTGPSALLVGWAPAGGGFVLQITGGDTPADVRIESLTGGARLGLTSDQAHHGEARLEVRVPAHTVVPVYGVAAGPEARLRVDSASPGGPPAGGEIHLQGLRAHD